MNRILKTALALMLAAALSAPAFAASVSFKFTKPENTKDTEVKINVYRGDARIDSVPVRITPGMSAEQKRDAIKAALEAEGYTVTSTGTPPQDPGITISGITKGREIYFNPGATGERADKEVAKNIAFSAIDFEGGFPSTDWFGDPAVFTAGVITDLGQVVVEYRASDVPPGTMLEGGLIAQRLFFDLLDAASDLGAWLDLEGSRILVHFDATQTRTGGGVVFGTSSPGPGLSGGGVVGDD